ncbi:ParB family chromosome partitioning protein [Maritimibacter alkaliphilus HTCC2654]|uniref:Replication protein, putative n=1 Tax=Maritimibacter alkaliphilus HTCC2654 TaxID=314271 RepID=A3VLK2_9RHOB|nr:ParB N-terminal domain-containing protein [Maritimibacter alkaliphilus]EAQ10890.1 replication protein, putative [Rhodobacterales bacterium HTCC2654] [Maritimibacter alkaliphilus HTCC2654]TYP80463.1 ParB family chromosome partitioning protein [Maritimibacter alkaliphilus HTCC2654]
MSRKRRIFDIDMPEDPPAPSPETFPAEKVSDQDTSRARRGPMATAISETASSARERQDIEARIRAENDALAHEHVRLKRLGLLVDLVPLDKIETHKLVRDRAKGPDMELAELKASIQELGLSNPIRVEAAGEGRFELIQGYRRLAAYRELLEETGDTERFGAIPAAVVAQGDTLDSLYRKMVDENLVRKDISFAEMAQLAVDYAADPGTPERDPDKVVARLFKSASYSKRSYIRSFIRFVKEIAPHLSYPTEVPRALGLALVARMDEVEGLPAAIGLALADMDNRSVQQELDVLRSFVKDGGDQKPAGRGSTPAGKSDTVGKAKTSFQFDRAEGRAKCTAASGRLEIRMDRDFTTVDRRKLEAAVRRLLDDLM